MRNAKGRAWHVCEVGEDLEATNDIRSEQMNHALHNISS